MNIITAALAAFKAKAAPVLNKARLWLTPSFWKNKVLVKLRESMKKLLDVRPADENDYYRIAGYYVSRKLAWALVLAAGLFSLTYILAVLPEKSLEEEAYRVYRYNSLPLKFQTGRVGILGKSGYLAYVGEVDSGAAAGQGTLYDPSGSKVYEGEFAAGRYNGEGVRYYQNETVRYQGGFVDNEFEGEGVLYRKDGTKEYEGGFHLSRKEGEGILYDESGSPVFQGSFAMDEIIYKQFLNKTAEEAAQMYTGRKRIYLVDSGSCIAMRDIGAVYFAEDGQDTLEEEWTVKGVYVLSDSAKIAGETVEDIPGLRKLFGAPEYEGNTALTPADAAAVIEAGGEALNGKPEIALEKIFKDVMQIAGMPEAYLVYIYRYEVDGCIYTFFCNDKNKGFGLYLIETAD